MIAVPLTREVTLPPGRLWWDRELPEVCCEVVRPAEEVEGREIGLILAGVTTGVENGFDAVVVDGVW